MECVRIFGYAISQFLRLRFCLLNPLLVSACILLLKSHKSVSGLDFRSRVMTNVEGTENETLIKLI
ncbi:hypothetical protein TorRG33x02_247350 [Trema orientale]|uniref:Uncharacterized protein n=1 Tax=Trema orientale TaxID=63057 RepID=A0A2P5DME6_TREOI|nr:hypothetical protein TorRG33x02_247350 [Trema orientale]